MAFFCSSPPEGCATSSLSEKGSPTNGPRAGGPARPFRLRSPDGMAAKGKYLVEPSTGGPDAVAGVVKAATALVNVVDGSVQHSSKFVIQNDELTIFSSLQVFSRFHTSFEVAELHDGAQRGSFEMCR